MVASVVAIDPGRRCTLGSGFATRPGRSEHEGHRLCGSTGSLGARRAPSVRVDRVDRSTKGTERAGRPGRPEHEAHRACGSIGSLGARRAPIVWVDRSLGSTLGTRGGRSTGSIGAHGARFEAVDRVGVVLSVLASCESSGTQGARLATFVAIDRGAGRTTSNFRGHRVARAVQGVHREGGVDRVAAWAWCFACGGQSRCGAYIVHDPGVAGESRRGRCGSSTAPTCSATC